MAEMTLVCLLSYSENCGKPSHTFQTNCRVTTHIHLLVQVFWAMEGGSLTDQRLAAGLDGIFGSLEVRSSWHSRRRCAGIGSCPRRNVQHYRLEEPGTRLPRSRCCLGSTWRSSSKWPSRMRWVLSWLRTRPNPPCCSLRNEMKSPSVWTSFEWAECLSWSSHTVYAPHTSFEGLLGATFSCLGTSLRAIRK